MKTPFSLIPLLFPTLGMTAGIVLSIAIGAIWPLAIFLCAAILLFILHHNYLALIALSVSFGSLSFLIYTLSSSSILPTGNPLTVEADVLSVNEVSSGRLITAEVRSVKDGDMWIEIVPTKISINVPSLNPDIRPGYRITSTFTVREPDKNSYLPDVEPYSEIFAKQRILYTALLLPDSILSVNESPDLLMGMLRMRGKVSDKILQSNLQPATKEFLNAVITGDHSSLDPDTRKSFALAGIAHILALSGLHVGIIASLIFIILYPLRVTGSARYIPLVTIVILWFYALFTGLSPSVTRAVIMASLLLASYIIQRRHSPLNALCLAAIVILTFDPIALTEISFQLSFLAVGGILIFAKRLNPVTISNKALYSVVSIFAVTIAAMLPTGIVSAWHFHSFPVYFLLTNVLISPFIIPLVGLGAIYVVFIVSGIDFHWLSSILDYIYLPVNSIASWVSEVPYNSLRGLSFTPLCIILYFIFLIVFALALYRRKISYYIAGFLILCITISISFIRPKINPEGIYLIPSLTRTDILVSSAGKAYIITNAPRSEYSTIEAEAMSRYAYFLDKRDIKSIYTGNSPISEYFIHFNDPIITLGTGKIALCASEAALNRLENESFKYIILSRGYTGTVKDVLSHCKTDTIIISRDIHPSRANRYRVECKENNQPYLFLREDDIPSFSKLIK